jgi:hypothetical protein
MRKRHFTRIVTVVLTVLIMGGGGAFTGCENDTTGSKKDEKNEKKTIDPLLVGGKWWEGSSGTQNIFYRFSETEFTAAIAGEESAVTAPAYTKDGKVLDVNTDTVYLSYVFVQESEYEDEFNEALLAGDQVLIYKYQRLKQAAASGNMVRFTVPGIAQSVEWARWENIPPPQ